MKIGDKDVLIKLMSKNRSNKQLLQAINQLITDFEQNPITSTERLLELRKDADKVHAKGFYFFNLHTHRALIFIEFLQERARIAWVGNHQEYVSLFKNNKNTIEKWLRNKQWIN
jgi:hypothetical protein